jgi:hypothetical protein
MVNTEHRSAIVSRETIGDRRSILTLKREEALMPQRSHLGHEYPLDAGLK